MSRGAGPLRAVALLLLVLASSSSAQGSGSAAPVAAALPPFEGSATWYGEVSRGGMTANGEAYDPAAFTAAHRDLPFGSLVRVTSLDTGASALVRINDRIPKSSRAVLVLSEAAARVLGLLASGEARVSCAGVAPEEAASFGSPRPSGGAASGAVAPGGAAPGAAPASTRLCRIVVASYRDDASASATVERLRLSGLEARVEREGATRRVVIADLPPARAEAAADRLRGLGYTGLVMTWYTR